RTEGGGYARTGFVVLPRIDTESYKRQEVSYFSNLAHECAHLWWANAPVNSWEDWLNESFAEYSALMAVRELFGTVRFESILAKKLKRSEGMPPIKGIKRNDERAFTVLYDKGCLVLYELEQMAGRKEFIGLLRKTFQQKVSSTEEFLQLVAGELGSGVAVQLDRMLTN
ncbi:MAG TPA: M1 family aminopeptidase, partial [Coprothermobacter proteolyticus]|nr:M1 family aminopeptidase [Coprothermobacter proteolyticus]